MSANLDLVRSIYADWERGDFSDSEWADPDIEWVLVEGPSPGTRHGVEGMAEGFREWMSAWEDVRIRDEELRELDEERVLVLIRSSGRGKTSEISLPNVKTAHMFHVREGKITRFVAYWDRERALADLGLEQ